MTRKFTRILAALALLVFMTPSLAGWGQTRGTRDYTELYSADFRTVAAHSYTQNKTFTLNDKNWTASVSQVNAGVFYLGCNSNNASKGVLNNNNTFSAEVTALKAADAIYNTNYTTAHAYALQFVNAYNNVSKVAFNWDGGNNAFQVYLFGDSGSGYVMLAHTDYSSSGASVSGSVEWTGDATNFTKFAIVARPGTTNGTATNKTLRAATFYIYETTGGSQPTTYTVTYDANGGTGTMTDSNSPYNAGATVTVLDNDFTRTDYTFDHWNTAADDSGTSYDEGDDFTINANTTLYAQWTENGGGTTTTVTYDFTDVNNFWTEYPGQNHPTSGTALTDFYYLNGDHFVANGSDNHKFTVYQGSAYFILGKKDATLQLPVFDFDVEKIEITGRTGASSNVTQNIYVGNNMVSTQTTGATGTNTYVIADGYQSAGTVYTLQVTSSANTQITEIKIYAKDTNAPSISASNVEIAYNVEEGEITYTINNPMTGGTITASTDAEWLMVDDEAQTDAEGSIYFTCAENSNFYAHSATVTLTYTYNNSKATVTKEVTVTQAGDPDANGSTAENPISVSEAIDAIDEVGTVSNIYVGGIVSNIEEEYSSQYHNITFDMIDEEGNEYFLRAYRCGGDEATNVAVGDEVVVYGNLIKFGTIYEFAQNCELVSLTHPVVPTITVTPNVANMPAEATAGENLIEGTLDVVLANMEVSSYEDFIIQYYDAEENELNGEDEPQWIAVLVAEQDPQIGEGYVVSYLLEENDGSARTAYFTVNALNGNDLVESNLVTVNQAAYVAPPTGDKYVKVTSTAELTDGQYLIVYEDGSVAFDGNLETLDAVGNTIAVTISNSEIAATETTTAAEFTIDVTNGKLKSARGYYIGVSSNSNGLKQTEDATTYTNSFSIDGDGNAVIAAVFDGSNMTMRYNSASNQNRFRYYGSGQQAIQLYKKVEPVTYPTLTIEPNQWYLIASPVGNIAPISVTNMITDQTYALYSFNQSGDEGKEWINYKNGNGQGFNLVAGKGYLYANQNGCTLTFTGTAYNGNGQVTLTYDNNAELKGFNLIGNPFSIKAYLANNRDFYVMNNGKVLAATTTAIEPMQGIFVVASDANDQSVTFTTTAPSNGSKGVVLNLTQNRGSVIDRAIVRFGEGGQLPKFQLFEDNAKLYIPQGNQEYAVVRSEGQGELPVNFRAAENGTYTLSMDVENMDVNYLHLIDNMTGMDVDLLQTPSYTFEATTRDYESRFRLVFASNNANADSDNFAFFSNGNLIINNEGNATLQVIDLNGRILSSESINGSCSTRINATAGVYMLRLINGDNVKVQKIVVR